MRRVNISNDVNSRAQIASVVHQTPVAASEVVTCNTEEDGKTEKVQGSEDNASAQAEPDTAPKRGRAAKRDLEKV